MAQLSQGTPLRSSGSVAWAGYLLGFALGGFFDGILLHQVLQWHHLLSGLEGGRFGDLRFQILADGLFHVLMYVIAVLGLWLLWRSRTTSDRPSADRQVAGSALIGFGLWHVLDGIASHWVLGIHRIRMDSQTPLLWDLLWFFVFGVAFIIAGYLLKARGGGGGRNSGAASAALVLLTLAMGFGAALPPTGSSAVVVVFGPGVRPADAVAAMAAAGGRLVWSDSSDLVWAVDLPPDAPVLEFYRNGALLVSGSVVPVGCLDWLRP